MSEHPLTVSAQPHDAGLDHAAYQRLYRESLDNPESFWKRMAEGFNWQRPFTQACNASFTGDVSIRWFEGGALNASVNCLDRHLTAYGDKPALIWEGDQPGESKQLTYRELHRQVCKLANLLKSLGVKKGDRVTIYLPMIVEGAVAMLACARIGAVHTVIFGGFSPDALRGRILDSGSEIVITADEGRRGGKRVPLKANVDEAVKGIDFIRHVLVVKHTGGDTGWMEERDLDYASEVASQPADCEPAIIESEDPLFILYTSGSTGKPKGVVHSTAGYLIWSALTTQYAFDLRKDDIYWCTADIGWVTGHSYLVYGPLANGATSLMFEGVPTYPDASRFWQVVDKHKVSIFYTAPTAIRSLMRLGDEWVKKTSRDSLRILATVGEPINPEAWWWYYEAVGEGQCPIVDTWWQTETGGHMILPLPGACDMKPGSASLPFFGIEPVVTTPEGTRLEGEAEGLLCIARSWPGQARTLFGDHKRFVETYFSTVPGMYFSGDGCKRDAEGHYWITGRVDDVINVSGHRIGTAEVESALVGHASVAEAAAIGFPHDIKGQGIYVFVILKQGQKESDALRKELLAEVRKTIGAIATPDMLQFVPGLPKTRSGKIMRRILRKIVTREEDQLGDVSTLSEPEIVPILIEGAKDLRH